MVHGRIGLEGCSRKALEYNDRVRKASPGGWQNGGARRPPKQAAKKLAGATRADRGDSRKTTKGL